MRFPTTLRQWLIPSPPTSGTRPELLHFPGESNGQYMRYHLRVDPNGPAILIAGASDALLLSPEGAVVAQAILSGDPVETLASRLEVSNPEELIAEVKDALAEFGSNKQRYPIFNLVDPSVVGQRLALVAPFQADLLVTEMSELVPIIDRLWDVGIPHVRLLLHTFEGLDEQPAIRREIVKLVTHAEDLGMIAGVRARASQLASDSFLIELAEAGLDYAVLPWGITETFHSQTFGRDDFEVLQPVIADIVRWEMTPVLNAALFPGIQRNLPPALDAIRDWGVCNVELFSIGDTGQTSIEPTTRFYPPQSLRQVASWIESLADQRRERLIWLPTVGRHPNESLEDAVRRGSRAGGDVAIQVLSDGNVVPPRGPHRVAGNLLSDPWPTIWSDSAFNNYRDRVELPTHCEQCPVMAICAADCPAEVRSWSTGDPT